MIKKPAINIYDDTEDLATGWWKRGSSAAFALGVLTTLDSAARVGRPFSEALKELHRSIVRPIPLILRIGMFLVLFSLSIDLINGLVRTFTYGHGKGLHPFEATVKAVILLVIVVCPLVERFKKRLHVEGLMASLDAGTPLNGALEAWVGPWLPTHVMPVIRDAERRGRLGDVLPLLARQLRYETHMRSNRYGAWPLVAVEAVVVALMMHGLAEYVLPIMGQMAADFGQPFPQLAWMMALRNAYYLILALTLWFVFFGKSRDGWGMMRLLTPGLRRDWERRQWRQLAQATQLYLCCGHDIIAAIEAGASTLRDSRLKKLVAGFLDRMRGGGRWGAAWAAMNLGPHLHSWIVVNAAGRENPASGFVTLADWLHGDISHTSKLIERFFLPVLIILLAAVVGVAAMIVHMSIATMSLTTAGIR